MASPNSSGSAPTSLLWAHQLKREHGFLLQRMQDLEAKNEKQEARISTAESASNDQARSGDEIVELAEQVKALNEAGVEGRLEAMERDVTEKLEGVQAESEAHTLQIMALQEDGKAVEAARKEATAQERTLLERIGAVEQNLTTYERSLERMGKRLDEGRFKDIKDRLEGLTEQVEREGEEMMWLTRSITALEKANAELTRANEKLEAEMVKMAGKPSNATNGSSTRNKHTLRADTEEEQQATPGADGTPPSKKKSHKWAGGGADRDIIRLGADMFGAPRTVQRSPQATSKQITKKRPAPPGPKKKQQAPQPPPKTQRVTENDSEDTPKKSHRWVGGGADRDIIQAGFAQPLPARRRQSSDVVAEPSRVEPPKKKPHRWVGGGADKSIVRAGYSPPAELQPKQRKDVGAEKKKATREISGVESDEVVVRSGKGWYEVRGPSRDAESEVPVKRKRGRPRKAHISPEFTLEELTQGRVTRHGVYQAVDQPSTKKRARGADPEDSSAGPTFKKTKTADSQPDTMIADEPAGVGRSSVPVSPPRSIHETVRYGSNIPTKGVATERGERPQIPRRQIPQFDGSSIDDEVPEME